MLAYPLRSKNVHVPRASPAKCYSFSLWQRDLPLPPMSFEQHLQLVLDPDLPLPLHIELGEYSCSWENGKLKFGGRQEGFRKLSRDELMQLMRRLQASPHVILLNLWGHKIDAATMREMAAPIAALSELQALVLTGACPFEMVGRSHSTTATATSRECFMSCCLILILILFCLIDWGRHRHSSLSMPHTLQEMALATKVAPRFLHLWFIFLI